MIFCHQCGAANDDGTKFCTKCGTQLAADLVANAAARAEASAAASLDSAPAPMTDAFASTDSAAQDESVPTPASLADAPAPEAPQPPVQPAYTAPAQPVYAQPAYAQPAYAQPAYSAPVATLDGRSLMARFAGGPLFLIITICYTTVVALDLLNLIFNIVEIAGSYYSGGVIATIAITSLVGLVLPVITCIGMWLFWAAAHSYPVTRNFATNGLSTLRVVTVIQLVLCCIVFGVAILGCLVATIFGGVFGSELDYYLEEALWEAGLSGFSIGGGIVVMGIICLLVCVGALILNIFYYTKMGKTIRACLYTASSGKTTPFVSTFVIVMLFIFGVTTLFGSLLGGGITGAVMQVMGAYGYSSANGLLRIVSSLLTAAGQIMMAISLIQYKNACHC